MIEIITPGNAVAKPPRPLNDAPRIAVDIPVIFEDEGQEEMGDSAPHSTDTDILGYGIESHLEDNAAHIVFKNLNLHYHPDDPLPNVVPDVMVVESADRTLKSISSYRIGVDGPAPVLAAEVLSPRTAVERDLTAKPDIYSVCGVAEYLLVDASGKFLPQRLLIRRRQPDGSWIDLQDVDGGVTSVLGFRVVFDDDGQIRVINAKTGERYPRPNEGRSWTRQARHEAEAAKRKAEQATREAEAAKRKAEQAIREAEETRREAEEAMRLTLQRARELEAEQARVKGSEPKRGD